MRKAGNRVRITGQLIDTTTRAHLWAERFEGTLDDIFELQDQVAASVVGAIAPQLERAEIERAKRKPTESLDAYDYYLRGMTNFHQGTRDAIDEALPLFYKAIELDPDFASAYGMAAWCYFWRKINGWMADPAREIAEGARSGAPWRWRWARTMRSLSPEAAMRSANSAAIWKPASHCSTGRWCSNPNLSAAWYLGGFQRISRGEPDEAIERFARAMRLSPLDPEMVRMQAGTAMAHLFAGRFDAASAWAETALRELPSFLMVVGIARGKPCPGRPNGRGTPGHGRVAPARSRAADFQYRRLGPATATGRSGAVYGWLANSRVAGMKTRLQPCD